MIDAEIMVKRDIQGNRPGQADNNGKKSHKSPESDLFEHKTPAGDWRYMIFFYG